MNNFQDQPTTNFQWDSTDTEYQQEPTTNFQWDITNNQNQNPQNQPTENLWNQPNSIFEPNPNNNFWEEIELEKDTAKEKSGIEFENVPSIAELPLQEKIEEFSVNNSISPLYIGNIQHINILSKIYKINLNNSKAIQDLDDSSVIPITSTPGKYDFSPKENTELGSLIKSFVILGKSSSHKIDNCNLFLIRPGESIPSLHTSSPGLSFIYVLKSSNSTPFQLDFTQINGPSIHGSNLIENILYIIPGWVPLKLNLNDSSEDIILIAGQFSQQ